MSESRLSGAADRYFAEDNEVTAEAERLATLARFYDPITRGWLEREAPLAPGARVLDAGCGGGGLLAWFADRVGETGEVLGLDRDLRHARAARPQIRLRSGDLTAPAAEPGRFDLVHARLVLEHLADPALALARLIEWTTPGGLVCVLDLDCSCVQAIDHSHPDAVRFNAVSRALTDALEASRLTDPNFGLKLGGLMREAGLERVLETRIDREELTGSDWARFQALNTRMIADLIGRPELGEAIGAMLDRPGLRYRDQALVAVVGTRPGG